MDDIYNKDVGEDLLPKSDEEMQSSPTRHRTKEEVTALLRKMKLEEKVSRKQMKKLEKQLAKGAMTSDEKIPETAKASLSDRISDTKSCIDIFRGGPATSESREFHRPLSGREQHAFKWRRLCDAAFQEHKLLKNVNFNWKSYRQDLWHFALYLLFSHITASLHLPSFN